MESDDSDSDDADKLIGLIEKIEAVSEDKLELFLDIYVNNQSVGYLSAIIINVGSLKSGGLIHEKLKCRDKEVEEEILLFYNSLSDTLNTNTIFYITDFFLEKEYRGMGIGGDVLKQLPAWLHVHHPEVHDLYLFPYPLEKSNGKVICVQDKNSEKLLEMRNKLIVFYLNHGLQKTNTQFLKMPIQYTA
ncbi:MAG: hypothetical protein ACRCTE_08995 [Cellulosilyticaceae bacterium]